MRDYPRLLDNRRTPLDPAVSVDYGLEAFDSEESNALEFSTALAPVVPSAPPTGSTSPVAAEPPVVPTRLVAPSAPAVTESTPATTSVPDWEPLVAALAAKLRASEPRVAPVDLPQASVASLLIDDAETAQSSVETSSALALLIGWLVAFSIAVLAFLAEGPPLIPTVKSALSRPAAPPAPPAPIVQTHRTEDVHLPSPKATKPRTAR
jgi:hypothetical protein